MLGHKRYSTDSGYWPVVIFYEFVKEHLDFIKLEEFLDQLTINVLKFSCGGREYEMGGNHHLFLSTSFPPLIAT
jgi:hypothetical protein